MTTATVMDLMARTSATTCDASCWQAREPVCVCSCGGANHGCLRVNGGIQPVRTRRCGRRWYELAMVGLRSQINAAHPAALYARSVDKFGDGIMVNTASASQIATWPELAAYRGLDLRWVRWADEPALLWRLVP